MRKKICIIILFATAFICADFEHGKELSQDIVDNPVATAGGLLQEALGVISGAAEETGEILTGDRGDRRVQREVKPPEKMRRVNRTYTQVK